MDVLFTQETLEYVSSLSSITERARIQQYIERQIELGHVFREPVSKSLGDGIHEIRPGPHRLLFFIHKGRILVIHAFRKKTQKTPQGELRAALRKMQEWLRREQSL